MKLLFPEVEVTKSLSSNLVKRGFTIVHQDGARVIDTNTLVAKRMEALAVKTKLPENEGFVAGMQAQSIDMESLSGEEAKEGTSGNVLKAHEEAEEINAQADMLKAEAARLLEEAKAEAQRLLSEAKEAAAREREAVFEEAKKQGYEEGQRRVQQESVRLRQEAEEEKKRLEAEYEQLVSQLEPQFIDTITDIYEHIFHVELHSYREVLVYLISATMRKVEGSRDFLIHVSKEDYPYVSMQKKQIMAGMAAANGSVEVVEDITLSQNECMIETDNGIFDCGLGTQLSELRQKLKLLSYEK